MKRNTFKFYLPAVIILLLLCPLSASAQSAVPAVGGASSQSALAVSPAITEDVVKPGTKTVVALRLTNTTNFPLPVSATVKNFVPLQTVEDNNMLSKYDASEWFTVADPDFILQPKQSRTVTVSIAPPAGSEPGGHYATIYFTPLIPSSALTPSTAYLSAQVGTLAFLIVPGAVNERIKIASLSAPDLNQSRDIPVSLDLENTGNVHTSPNVSIDIVDWRGGKVASLLLRPGIVLPSTTKKVTAVWHAPSFVGKYSAIAHVSYGPGAVMLVPVRDDFWVLPWELLLAVGVPLVCASIVAMRTRGRWRHAASILLGKQQSAGSQEIKAQAPAETSSEVPAERRQRKRRANRHRHIRK